MTVAAKSWIKFVGIFLYVCLASYVYWHFIEKSWNGIDDANIYFVYMRNLSQGQGFVYNVGGEKVEGFTSLLWCIIGAGYFFISKYPNLLLIATSITFISVALWKMVCFVDNYFQSNTFISPQSIFILLSVFIFPGYFDWTILSILETGLWSALLMLATVDVLNNRTQSTYLDIQLSVILVLMVFSRPESYIWGIIFIGLKYITVYSKKKNIRFALQQIVLPAFSFVSAIIILTAWRLYYFGYPLPNTYYAKVSDDRLYNITKGYEYVISFITVNSPLLLMFPFVIAMFLYFIFSKKDAYNIRLVLCVVTVVSLLIPLYTGGDHFFLGRFIQPTLPIFYLAYVIAFCDIFILKIKYAFIPYVFLVIYVGVILLIPYHNTFIRTATHNSLITHEFSIANKGRQFGDELNGFFSAQKKYPTHGIMTAGGMAFTYKGESIDMLGLNNVAMAHSEKTKNRGLLKNHASFNKQVFYTQAPDLFDFSMGFMPISDTVGFILPENQSNFKEELSYYVFKQIHYDTLFRQLYFPVIISRNGFPRCLFIYAHKDFLRTLDSTVYHYTVLERNEVLHHVE